MVLIPNTLELTTLWVTQALEAEVLAHPELSLRDRLSPDSVRRAGQPRAGRAVSGKPSSAEASILIRAVVFDLDGLMFDTEALFFRVASEASPIGERRSLRRS